MRTEMTCSVAKEFWVWGWDLRCACIHGSAEGFVDSKRGLAQLSQSRALALDRFSQTVHNGL